MNHFKKAALAGAIGALMLTAGSAQAHVSYHISATGGEAPNTNGTTTTGSWTGGSPAAKGYSGNLPTTWLANVHNYNTVYDVSKADAIAESASVDSATFKLESHNNKWNPLHSWGNALDFGLINLDKAGNLTITVQAETGSIFQPGFTLWQGWDATSSSSKHGSWNANPNAPTTRGSNELSYIGHASTNSSGNGVNYSYDSATQAVSITFNGLNAGKYSLWIGGNATGTGICGDSCTSNGSTTSKTATTNQQYMAKISVAQVPVPAAVWLFGSAMAGLVGIGRRKKALAA